MKNAAAPSCSVAGQQRRNRQEDTDADSANQHAPDAPVEHDMFGDWNLNIVMMFMLLLYFMQHAMRQPCGC